MTGNNNCASSSSKHEKHQPNDSEIEIEELEIILGADYKLKDIHAPVPECCIYKVPKDLRKINEEAYTPQIISIGPLHHGNTALIEMEKQKLIYVSEFSRREGAGAEKLKEFKLFIEEKEQSIRNYYQQNSSLESSKFVNMILRDAVFIIEFFLKNETQPQVRKFDFFLDKTCVKAAITRDLLLLENQLPYFLLKTLFKKGAFPNFTEEDYPGQDPFLVLSHLFFFGDIPKPNNEIQQYEIQHFTDLRRYFLLMDFPPQDQKQGELKIISVKGFEKIISVRDLPSATKLHVSGVKFMGIEGGSSLGISCDYVQRAMRIPFTTKLMLRIPRFVIDDLSECLYRNMMALELCHYPYETHICNFILLMDFLIKTEEDVDLLVEEGVIFNSLGDNATIATMFNNLGLQITPSHSVYHNICKKLKEHYDRHWKRTVVAIAAATSVSMVLVLIPAVFVIVGFR